MNIKKYLAEFVGTFVLVVFGCGAAVGANGIITMMGLPMPLGFSTLLISFAFGLSIVAMAYSIGNVSGCHINPAVSTAMLVAGRMDLRDFIGYVASQFAGAAVGALFLSYVFGSKESLGQNGFGSASALGIGAPVAVAIEIVLTFVFVLVILEVTSKEEFGSVAGLVIGLTLTLIHIFGIPFTGTSVNPARSFGPAVVAGGDALKQLPVFILAPIIGAILAALFDTYILSENAVLGAKAPAPETDADGFAGEEPAEAAKAADAAISEAGEAPKEAEAAKAVKKADAAADKADKEKAAKPKTDKADKAEKAEKTSKAKTTKAKAD